MRTRKATRNIPTFVWMRSVRSYEIIWHVGCLHSPVMLRTLTLMDSSACWLGSQMPSSRLNAGTLMYMRDQDTRTQETRSRARYDNIVRSRWLRPEWHE